MLGSSGGGATFDDVAIRCHLRRAEQATEREFSDLQDMTCTMRVWHKSTTGGPLDSSTASSVVRRVGLTKTTNSFEGHIEAMKQAETKPCGPELIFTPNELRRNLSVGSLSGDVADSVQLSERFASFGSGNVVMSPNGLDLSRGSQSRPRSSRSSSRQRMSRTPVRQRRRDANVLSSTTTTISVDDIKCVDLYGQGDSHQCNITTESQGYFEIMLDNQNGQDVLFAFLMATLPKDRVVDGHVHRSRSGVSHHTHSTGSRSYDVEAFTASRMAERLKGETISEKLRRKVGRMFSSFEEISSVFSECACGCSKDSVAPAPPEKRDSPPHSPRQQYHLGRDYARFEMAPDRQSNAQDRSSNGFDDSGATTTTLRRKEFLKEMPSGLSVEQEEPEMVTVW